MSEERVLLHALAHAERELRDHPIQALRASGTRPPDAGQSASFEGLFSARTVSPGPTSPFGFGSKPSQYLRPFASSASRAPGEARSETRSLASRIEDINKALKKTQSRAIGHEAGPPFRSAPCIEGGAGEPAQEKAQVGDQPSSGSWLSDLLARASCDDAGLEPADSPLYFAPPGPARVSDSALGLATADASANAGNDATPFGGGLAAERDDGLVDEQSAASIVNADAAPVRPTAKLDELNKILRMLHGDCPGVEASALISEDGLLIASALASDTDDARIAGMAATLLDLGRRAVLELGRGGIEEVIARAEHGYAILIDTGCGALLLTLANKSSKLGLVFYAMQESVRALERILRDNQPIS